MLFNKNKDLIPLEFTPVFIGGTGRSGTSLLHATCCTDFESGNTNEFLGESYFLKYIIEGIAPASANYDKVHYSYFNTPGELGLYYSNLVRQVLIDIWQWCNKPKNLILKEPGFCLLFNIITQILPEAKFLMTQRYPLDVISSFKTVYRDKEKRDYNEELHKKICVNHIHVMLQCFEIMKTLNDKYLLVRYEDLVESKSDASINNFLGINIDDKNLWKSQFFTSKEGWITDKYNAPRQKGSVNNYKKVLSPEEIEVAYEITQPLFKELGYSIPPEIKSTSQS